MPSQNKASILRIDFHLCFHLGFHRCFHLGFHLSFHLGSHLVGSGYKVMPESAATWLSMTKKHVINLPAETKSFHRKFKLAS